jgi:hypothetical protein|tara:strand:+ start:381 stop:668 length:288 start_codon:yes stop_codon:yes gene_type:complete
VGEVYQARDTKLDRDAALEVLLEAFTSDPDSQGTNGAAETATTRASATELAAVLDSRIPALLEDTGVSGLAVAIVEGDDLEYLKEQKKDVTRIAA